MKRTIYTLINVTGWALVTATVGYLAFTAWEFYPSKLSFDTCELLLFFALLFLVFFISTERSFIYRKNQGYLSPIHFAMIAGLVMAFLEFRTSSGMSNFILFVSAINVFNANAKTLRFGLPVGNWRYTSNKALTEEVVLDILNEKAMLIDIAKKENVTLIRGRSSLIFDIRVELSQNQTKINIGYQQTWLVLIFAMKILPFRTSEAYVKKFMSALNSKGAENAKTRC